MAIFENFPYTNFHEMNQDWLIKRVKELESEIEDFKTILENGAVVDVQADLNGSWTSVKDANGIAKLPDASDVDFGCVKYADSTDTGNAWVTLQGDGNNEKLPALNASNKIDPSLYDVTFPVTDVKSYDNGSWVSCVNGSGVAQIPKADPDSYGTIELETTADRNDRVVKVTGLQYSDYLPALQDVSGTYKLDAGVIPDSGVTAGTYGTSPTPITAAWATYPGTITVGDDGRITAAAYDTVPYVRCITSSIAAGGSYTTLYCDSTYGPTYNGTQWAFVRAYTITENMGITYFNPLIEGTDYSLSYRTSQVTVNLLSVRSDIVYVQLIGAFGQSGK